VNEPATRSLRDPRALRAVAHRVRIRLLEELSLGAATATQLAERVGESPANCSWHLRQLARYGYVEEAGGGTGRQRPWKIVMPGHEWDEADEDPEVRLAGRALSKVFLARQDEVLQEWLDGAPTEPPGWREAAFVNQGAAWLTAEELAQIDKEVRPILTRYFDRFEDPARRPVGARLVRFLLWGVPAPGVQTWEGHEVSADDGGGP
jgi:DNA-binding transcriptional ArsR family regulator